MLKKINAPVLHDLGCDFKAKVITCNNRGMRCDMLVSYDTPIAAVYNGKLCRCKTDNPKANSPTTLRHYKAFIKWMGWEYGKDCELGNLPEVEVA